MRSMSSLTRPAIGLTLGLFALGAASGRADAQLIGRRTIIVQQAPYAAPVAATAVYPTTTTVVSPVVPAAYPTTVYSQGVVPTSYVAPTIYGRGVVPASYGPAIVPTTSTIVAPGPIYRPATVYRPAPVYETVRYGPRGARVRYFAPY